MANRITRRTVLKGAGVSLALPWMEAMAATTPSAAPPVRFAALYMPNGVNVTEWIPKGTGREFELSPTLQPLKNVKDDILVVSNLWNENSKTGDGHYVKEAAILTCTTIKKTPGADLSCNGISVDQVIAQKVGNQTPLPSLELGVTPVATGIDAAVGYTRIYGSHIAWAGPTNPLAREINPRSAYERLFRAASPQGKATGSDALLLDSVLGDAKRLRPQISGSDRTRLDEYLSIVRSLEERMTRASSTERKTWKARAPFPASNEMPENPKDHGEHVRLMLDIMALAFQTDTTRVCTFMFGNAVSNISFRFLEGVSAGHHDVSHHDKNPDKLRQYQIINQWHIEQYAYLLNKLKSMKEGDSTVLDNSVVVFASALSDGNKHDPHKLPIVVGGRGGKKLATGQHLVYTDDTPLSNLYMSLLEAVGTPVDRFADSTGKLPGVLA